MKNYNDVNVDPKSETAVVKMLADLFNDVAFMEPADVWYNIRCVSEGGFPDEYRTYKASTIKYLLNNFALIFMGLLINADFRKNFLSAISMERAIDDMPLEKQKELRDDMNDVKDLRAQTGVNEASIVFDLSHYDDEVFKKINGELLDSFTLIDGYDDAINLMIEEQSGECKEEYGSIVSNFAYLIRAFEMNPCFFAYISNALENIKRSIGLSRFYRLGL